MRFSVSVPVLSVQMTVVEPIVSQAWSLRTRNFALNIRRMLIARLNVTAIGRPSGTETTTSVTASISDWRRYAKSCVAGVAAQTAAGSRPKKEMSRPTMTSAARQ